MVKAKICGIARLEDALLAQAGGAWALGFILVPSSKRYLPPQAVRPIAVALEPLLTKVGVFMDLPPKEVLAQMQTAGLQVAQLHGQEPPEWAEAVRVHFPVIKAVRLSGPLEAGEASRLLSYPCDALLVDGTAPGSGQSYPLDWLEPLRPHPRLMVAGGLRPDNLDTVLALNPYAVDVSSGVEAAPAQKDPHKLQAFLAQVHAHNAAHRA